MLPTIWISDEFFMEKQLTPPRLDRSSLPHVQSFLQQQHFLSYDPFH